MLRLIQIGNSLPTSFPVDPTSVFQPGMIAQLKVIGNEIVAGVSDGTAPFGIIDEVRTSAFSDQSKDEVVIVPVMAVSDGYQLVTVIDTDKALRNSNIIRSSFVADIEGIVLNEVNGVITVSSGTPLNFDANADGTLDSVRVIVDYTFRLANIPGDDTTAGSGRMTIWNDRGIFETNQYDISQRYVVNATLFVNENGLLTTKQPSASHPGVALVTGPPSGIVRTLEFMWY